MHPTELSGGDSGRLSRMDARAKVLAAGVCMAAVSAIQGFGPAMAALGFALALPLVAGIRLKSVLLRLVPANIFFLFLVLVLGLTYPGNAVESVVWLTWFTRDGLEVALRIVVKGNTLLLMFIALVCTSTVPALSQALQSLGVPRKLTLLLALSHRQIFLVMDEFQRLHRAALARCFSPRCSVHAYKTIALLFSQTLLRSLARAERIHGAMLLRGFTGRFHALIPFSRLRRDAFQAALLGLMPLLICLYDRWPP